MIKKLISRWRACSRLVPLALLLFLLTWIWSELLFVQIGPLTSNIIDWLTTQANRSMIVERILMLVWIGLLDALANRICRTTKDYIQSVIRGKFMQTYYDTLLTKDYQYLTTLWTWIIQSKMEKWIDAEVQMYVDILIAILSVGVRTTILSVVFFRTMPWINAIFVILWFVVLITHRLLLPRIKRMQDRLSAISDDASAQSTKIAMERHTIRLHNQQSHEMNKITTIRSEHPPLAWRADLINEVGFVLMELWFRSLNGLGYFIMGASVLKADITLGTMVMIIMYIDRMRRPISTLMQQMSNRRKNIVRSERMHSMLEKKNILTDWVQNVRIPLGDIVIDDITFGYKQYQSNEEDDDNENKEEDKKSVSQPTPSHLWFTHPLFSHFSLTIPQGKMTALVGRSGSGKTTLIKLLLRLYDVNTGKIMIGTQNLHDLIRSDWYRHIGYLSQDPGIFDGTVRENLMYWVQEESQPWETDEKEKKEITDKKLWKALESACIDDRVKSFSLLLDEPLGEKWVRLSGWEKQRLAIARLFLRNPQLIILDEPSAALDSESEHRITKSFDRLFAGKTVIVIAHRLQTVMHADRIIVMDKGSIVEQGTHTDLVARKWTYAWLVDLQHGRIGE